MKKIIKLVLLCIAMISTVFICANVYAAVAEKGQLGLNETVVGDGSRVEITTGKFEKPGDIQVKKIVEKTDKLGRYKVTFEVKGKKVINTQTTTKPVYAVVVFDKSGSMKNEGREKKWDNAVNGAITFSNELIKNVPKAQIALVLFSGSKNDECKYYNCNYYNDANIARNFRNSVFNTNDFGSPDGGTNLGEGLRKAESLLASAPKDAYKYVVVIGDGEPTYYTDNNGLTQGPGNEMNNLTKQYAYDRANAIKNLGVEIFSIGYSVDRNSDAEQVLKNISSQNLDTDKIKHYYNANPQEVAKAFTDVSISISEAFAGTGAVLTDGLGEKFSLVSGTGRSKAINIGDITETEKVTEPFYIDIDPNSPTGWHDTNAGFVLNYKKPNGEDGTIRCDVNPQAYWIHPININVSKEWDDHNNIEKIRPQSVTVNLLANGVKINSVELSERNNWRYTFTELDEHKNGEKINYEIKENSVNGYTTTYNANEDYTSVTIKNTHKVEPTEVKVIKKWENHDIFMNNMPTIILNLYYKVNENDTWKLISTVDLKSNGNVWEHTWKSANGFDILPKSYIYKVEEVGFKGIDDADYIFENFFDVSYEKNNNNFTIINKCNATFELPETGSHMMLFILIALGVLLGIPSIYMVYTFVKKHI